LTVGTVIETVLEGQFSISSGRAAIHQSRKEKAPPIFAEMWQGRALRLQHTSLPLAPALLFCAIFRRVFTPQRPQTPLTRRRPRQGTLSLQGPSPPLRLGSNGASTSSMLHPPPRLPRVSGACIHNLDPDGGVITRSFPGTHIAGDAGGDQQGMGSAAGDRCRSSQ
jgi:hypothetical protein